ncbi:MAG: porin family protein [Micropepsaceae bacterium]
MKTFVSALALSAALTGAASAEGMYVEVFGGADFAPDLEWNNSDYEMDTGYSYGAALGWNLTPNWSVEGEIAYHEADYACCTSNASLLNLSVNGYYTFNPEGQFKPYVGAGIGYGELAYESGGQIDDWVFTYQVMAGARVAVASNTELVAEYRYVGSANADTSFTEWEYRAHVLSAGLRFNF